MELIYVDESGDTGFAEGSKDYFLLCGISIESEFWKEYYWEVRNLRRTIYQKFGTQINELKGSDIFTHRGPFFSSNINNRDLVWIYNHIVNLICNPMVNAFVVFENKREFERKFGNNIPGNIGKLFTEGIWRKLLIEIDEYLLKKSRKSKKFQNGMIFFDYNPSQEKYIRKIIREFSRRYDKQVKFPSSGIIEDVVFIKSETSYFIQLSDILAFSMNRIIYGKREKDILTIEPSLARRLMDKLSIIKT
ncbi:MAG: DUF3800 domain-containing protein [Candidatus Eremiobacteraeota bacterium]|nr:DUF3800 domain-containing protein [Candidatus Eremiobacteraeota bacterium]